MKKSFAFWVLLGMASGAAYGQSSVKLYGLIDEGVNYNSNAGGKRLYNLSSGELQGSRWGLRGTEDLGGGLADNLIAAAAFNKAQGQIDAVKADDEYRNAVYTAGAKAVAGA